jgi:hypothetical protein
MKSIIAALVLSILYAFSPSFAASFQDGHPKTAAKKKCAASCESHAAFSKNYTRAGAINASRQTKAAATEKSAAKTK